MPAVNCDEIPDEPVRPGVRRRGFGTTDVMLVRNGCEPGVAVRPHIHAFDQNAMIPKAARSPAAATSTIKSARARSC
jgi:hypothetical protein